MSASRDVLAFASLEVDLTIIQPGTTVTVKWPRKLVFIGDDDINLGNSSADVNSLRDPQEDSVRVKDQEWLIVVGAASRYSLVPQNPTEAYFSIDISNYSWAFASSPQPPF